MRKSLIILFVVATVLLLNFVIPPIQSPDEPQHFAAVMGFANAGSAQNAPHAEIIRFMDKNRWWRYLGMGKPDKVPEKLERVSFLMGYNGVSDYTLLLNDILIYHFGVGKLIGLSAKRNVPLAYYLVRLISVLMLAGALYFFYRIFKNISVNSASPRSASWMMTGFYFILFLPQLLITSVAANPDCALILLGAIFFWAAFSVLRGRKIYSSALILLFIVLIGLLLDRSNYFMLPVFFLALIFAVGRKNSKRSISLILGFLGPLILLFFVSKLFIPSILDKVFYFARVNLPNGWTAFKSIFSLDPLNRTFFGRISDSFLLKFGWSAYSVSSVFYWVWRFVIMMGILGILIYTGKVVCDIFSRSRRNIESGRSLAKTGKDNFITWRQIGFCTIAVLLQVLAVRVIDNQRNLYVQGRYFFPLLVPIAFLLVFGLKSFFDAFDKKKVLGAYALKVLIVLEFIFLNFVIWNDVIPVFHITLRSPHPGA